MGLEGSYEPGSWGTSNEHVERYERSGGTKGVTVQGVPCVVLWTRGRKTGAVRKAPVIRVEDGGRYAVVGSKGGSDKHPEWYLNLLADPHVTLQDGPEVGDYVAHAATPEERAEWWPRAVEVFPMYATYQSKTEREISIAILVAES